MVSTTDGVTSLQIFICRITQKAPSIPEYALHFSFNRYGLVGVPSSKVHRAFIHQYKHLSYNSTLSKPILHSSRLQLEIPPLAPGHLTSLTVNDRTTNVVTTKAIPPDADYISLIPPLTTPVTISSEKLQCPPSSQLSMCSLCARKKKAPT